MNTTFEQHKVQLRKKQNKRAPTREHRRSKAMSVSAIFMYPYILISTSNLPYVLGVPERV